MNTNVFLHFTAAKHHSNAYFLSSKRAKEIAAANVTAIFATRAFDSKFCVFILFFFPRR